MHLLTRALGIYHPQAHTSPNPYSLSFLSAWSHSHEAAIRRKEEEEAAAAYERQEAIMLRHSQDQEFQQSLLMDQMKDLMARFDCSFPPFRRPLFFLPLLHATKSMSTRFPLQPVRPLVRASVLVCKGVSVSPRGMRDVAARLLSV